MKKYLFGINYNAYEKCEESYLTSVTIPAKDEADAMNRLKALLGKLCERAYLADVSDYE